MDLRNCVKAQSSQDQTGLILKGNPTRPMLVLFYLSGFGGYSLVMTALGGRHPRCYDAEKFPVSDRERERSRERSKRLEFHLFVDSTGTNKLGKFTMMIEN